MTAVLLASAAFGVRYLVMLKQGTAWFDESFSMHFASMPLPDMLRLLAHDVHPPLHAVALHGWMRLFGEGLMSARMLSVVLGALAVPVMMRLAGRYGKGPSVVAGIVTAFSPILLFHSADARMYPLLLLLVALATQAFLDMLDGDRKASVPWAAYAGLALLTHVAAILPFVVMCGYGFAVIKDRRRLLVASALSALPAALWVGAFTLRRIGLGGGEWQLAMPSRGGSAIIRFLDLFAYASGSWLRALLLPLLIALVAAAVLRFRRAEGVAILVEDASDAATRFLFLSAILPFLIFLPVHIETTKYLFVAYPALVTLVAIGASRLFGEKGAVKAVLVYLVIIAFPVWLLMSERRIRWDDAAAFIEKEERPGDIIYATWFAMELPLRAEYRGESEILSAYAYDSDLSFDERLVKHAGQMRVDEAIVERMASAVEDAPHVFFVGGEVDIARQPIPRWFFAEGWRLEASYESNGFSPVVLKLANPDR